MDIEQQPARVVHVWTPLAVGVYALLLHYPSGVALAVRNWFVLDRRRDAAIHLVAALMLTVPFVVVITLIPRIGTIVNLVLRVAAFSYLKARQKSDLEDLQLAEPGTVIVYRRWYTGCGWVVLGLSIFILMAASIKLVAMIVAKLAIAN